MIESSPLGADLVQHGFLAVSIRLASQAMDVRFPPFCSADLRVVDQRCAEFEYQWSTLSPPPDLLAFVRQFCSTDESLNTVLLLELVCIDMEYRWHLDADDPRVGECTPTLGTRPTADDYCRLLFAEPNRHTPLKWILCEWDVRQRCAKGEGLETLRQHYANRSDVVSRLAALDHATLPPDLNPTVFEQWPAPSASVRCPQCGQKTSLPEGERSDHVECSGCGHALNIVRISDDSGSNSPSDRFELLDRLGGGGFGVVWKAYDHKLKRQVALKIPRASRFDSTSRQRFLRESQAAAKLDHPGIVPVYDVCTSDRNVPVIVAKLIDGQSLSSWLAVHPYLDSREAAKLCADLADALSHAHLEGVVHRDLKPANILMDVQGRSFVTDFGLAKDLQHEDSITGEGDVMGTAAYMSPEQASGQGRAADARCDVYALGVILFELVTGERPFRGTVQMLLHHVVHVAPPPPRSLNAAVPVDCETIILKCLEKNPQNRYATAADLRDDLLRFVNYQAIQARPPTVIERFFRWFPAHANLMLGTYFIVTPITWVIFILGGLFDGKQYDALQLASPVLLPWAVAWAVNGGLILRRGRWFEILNVPLLLAFSMLPAFIEGAQSITLVVMIASIGWLLQIGAAVSRRLRPGAAPHGSVASRLSGSEVTRRHPPS